MMASEDIMNLREIGRSPCKRNVRGGYWYRVKVGIDRRRERHKLVSGWLSIGVWICGVNKMNRTIKWCEQLRVTSIAKDYEWGRYQN
jgi:hypothetical protein